MSCTPNIIVSPLPAGSCLPSELYDYLTTALQLVVTGCSGCICTVTQSTPPGPENLDYIWNRISETGVPLYDLVFYNGEWRRKPTTPIGAELFFTGDPTTVFNAVTRFGTHGGQWDGWQIIIDPLVPMVVVNIPSTPVRKQAAMHSQTGAWTLFSGWDARCFARRAKELYFGTGNSVCRITGSADNGANITATLSQAYSRWGYSNNKQSVLVKAYLQPTGDLSYNLGISYDLRDPREITTINRTLATSAALWGSAIWGVSYWTGSVGLSQEWQTVPDEYSMWKGLYVQAQSRTGSIFYAGSDILFTQGGNF